MSIVNFSVAELWYAEIKHFRNALPTLVNYDYKIILLAIFRSL